MEMSVVVNGELYFRAAPMIRGIEDGIRYMRPILSDDEFVGCQTVLNTMYSTYQEEAEFHGLDARVPDLYN